MITLTILGFDFVTGTSGTIVASASFSAEEIHAEEANFHTLGGFSAWLFSQRSALKFWMTSIQFIMK